MSWKEFLVKEYYDRILVVFIHDLGTYGSTEKLGAFVSEVTYKKDGEEYTVLMENEDFAIVDEIVFHHVEE